MSEQKVNPVIIHRAHLHMISVDLLLANFNLGEVSSDCVKINKNLDMNLLLNMFHVIQHCLIITEMLGDLNDIW